MQARATARRIVSLTLAALLATSLPARAVDEFAEPPKPKPDSSKAKVYKPPVAMTPEKSAPVIKPPAKTDVTLPGSKIIPPSSGAVVTKPPATGGGGSTSDGPRRGDGGGRIGTPGTPGATYPPPRGGGGDGRPGGTGDGRPPSEGGGNRNDRNNLVPGIIIGAAAAIAVASLLQSTRSGASQPSQPNPPPDQVVNRLLAEGPIIATAFNMSAFAVRGFVRGNWPLLIDFQQRSEGLAKLQISARDVPEIFEFDLTSACPPPRRCLITMRLPPELFGDQLRPAVIAATATDAKGNATQPEFNVYALGAGPRAVGSVAIDQVTFGPSAISVAAQQSALYRFFSHSDFSNASVEFWKVEDAVDGSRMFLVDDRRVDGGVRKNQWVGMNERRSWDGREREQRVSPGRHKVQVRAWDRVGDWVTALSNDVVTVEQ
jgi:hypothetical protein